MKTVDQQHAMPADVHLHHDVLHLGCPGVCIDQSLDHECVAHTSSILYTWYNWQPCVVPQSRGRT